MKYYLIIAFCVISMTSWGQKNKSFSEDLSKVRPTFSFDESVYEVTEDSTVMDYTPTHHVNMALDSTMDVLAEKYAEFKFVRGWRVQVYTGNNFTESKAAMDKLKAIMPEEKSLYKEYKAPIFRVKVGDFHDKLPAYRMFRKLKEEGEEFEDGLLVPDNILLERIK